MRDFAVAPGALVDSFEQGEREFTSSCHFGGLMGGKWRFRGRVGVRLRSVVGVVVGGS